MEKNVYAIRLLLLLVAASLYSTASLAQSYEVSASSSNAGNPGGLNTNYDYTTTGGTIVHDGGQNGGLGVNSWSDAFDIPFAFDFYGQSVDSAVVSKNGLLSFTTSVAGSTLDPSLLDNTCLPNPDLPANTVAYFWDQFASPQTYDYVYAITYGTAPNRQLWLLNYSFPIGSFSYAYFAVVLEESTNKIYMVDMNYLYPTGGGSSTVGVQQDAANFQQAGFPLTGLYGSPSIDFGSGGTNYTDNEYYTFEPSSSATNMSFTADNSVQFTTDASPGQGKAKILQLTVDVAGNLNPLTMDKIYFSTTGTTSPSTDIDSARLYYTSNCDAGSSPLLSSQQVSTIGTPSTSFMFNVNQSLYEGSNSFYLTYDVDEAATLGNFLDATVDSFIIDGVSYVPTVSNPTGSVELTLEGPYCGISVNYAGNYQIGAHLWQFAGINNTSLAPQSLQIFPNPKPTVTRGNYYDFTYKGGSGNDEDVKAWVDWNNDGFYSGDEEILYINDYVAPTTVSDSFYIPCGVSPGLKRMRIVADLYVYVPTPCASNYGGAEEYFFYVAPDESPTPSFSVEPNYYVGGLANFTNTTVGAPSINYEWDFDNDGVYDSTGADGSTVFSSPGQKIVTLKATLQGCDGLPYSATFTDTINVVTPTQLPVAEFIADRNVLLPDMRVTFEDLTTQGPGIWNWTISPATVNGKQAFTYVEGTNANSQHPVVEFHEIGKYTVALTAVNNYGTSNPVIKNSYIEVVPISTMCTPAAIDTTDARNGYLVDDGGVDGLYADGSTSRICTYLIEPNCASPITLSFLEFDVNSYTVSSCTNLPPDYIKIYDGTDATGIPLHTQAGFPDGFTNGPNNTPVAPPSVTAQSGAMYIEFHSNCAFRGEGFLAVWSSGPAVFPLPVTSMEAPDTAYVDAPQSFASTSTGDFLEYSWDVDGDGISDYIDSAFIHTYTAAGIYPVELIVSNCGGSDTVQKNITVINPSAPPVADFTADFTTVPFATTVTLQNQSTEGPTNFRWTITPNNFNWMNGTDEFSKNPQVSFTQTGLYTVKLWVENALGADSVTKTNYINVFNYCNPSIVFLNSDLGISNVEVRTITGDLLMQNSSDVGKEGYTDYSSKHQVAMDIGASYSITVDRNTSINTMTRAVWIDLNKDGDFSANERMAYEGSSTSQSWTETFTIPATAVGGLTRMRVSTNVGNQANLGCGPNFSGEYEDYAVILNPDNAPPVIDLLGTDTVWVELGTPYVDAGATAFDNVDGTLTGQIAMNNSVDVNVVDTYYVNFSVTDQANNTAYATRVVIVTPDATDPVITLTPPDTMQLPVFATYTEPGFTASDNTDGSITNNVQVTNNVDTSVVGNYQVIYTVSDQQGNTDTAIRLVMVQDTTQPVLNLLGDNPLFVEFGDVFTDPGYTASDNYDDTVIVQVGGAVNTSQLGTYTLTYTVEDSSGNGPIIMTRTVVVGDTTKPDIALIGPDDLTVDVFDTWWDPGVKVSDNYSEDLDVEVFTMGTVNTNVLDDYTLEYYAVDEMGNHSDTLVRTVHVVDRERPVISLNGPMLVELRRWENWTDPGATAMDNYYGNVAVQDSGSFTDSGIPGIYTITYYAEDPSGNKAIPVTRTIIVDTLTSSLGEHDLESWISYYPNPAQHEVNIQVTLPERQDVAIRLLNSVGQEVRSVENSQIMESFYQVNLQEFSSGLYFIQFQVGDEQLMKKLIINR